MNEEKVWVKEQDELAKRAVELAFESPQHLSILANRADSFHHVAQKSNGSNWISLKETDERRAAAYLAKEGIIERWGENGHTYQI
ncbi:MAG: hypothetical protein H8Z69_02845 [Nanohaloarchaea archaeon]|nr:hypothetical protein [Candidatus Nanohaloarchaea archaeon]